MADPIDDDKGEGTEEGEKIPAETKEWDWKAEIPETLRSDAAWNAVPDFPTLAKNYVDGVKYTVGAIKLPSEGASVEEWDKVYQKMGRPESAEGYVNPAVPDTEQLDTAMLISMKGVAHSAGLSKRQWDVMTEGFVRQQREGRAHLENAATEATEVLRGEWGAAYERNVSLANRAIHALGGEDAFEEMKTTGAGNRPSVIRMFTKVGHMLAESGVILNEFEGMQTMEEMHKEANDLSASKAYLDPKDPGHKDVANRVTKLYEAIYN